MRSLTPAQFRNLISSCGVAPRVVGIVNTWIPLYATRFVYSTEPDFILARPEGTLGGRSDFFAHIQRHAPA